MTEITESSLEGKTKRVYTNYSDYGGPLGYYHSNSELHDLSRRQLADKRSGLYRALLRYKQLVLAIPNIVPRNERNTGRKPIPESEVDRIVEFFYANNKNILRTAKDTDRDPSLIRKYLRLREIKFEGKSGRPRKDRLKHENPC